jgi:alpha/beta superfamily hydrolase
VCDVVRKGEYLERAVAIAGEAGPIEGLYHRGTNRPAMLIAPPHPMSSDGVGGSLEMPVVAELAYRVTRAGHPTMRFNYRGVGASAGTFDPEQAFRDASAAFDQLEATVRIAKEAVQIAVAGVGFGAEVAVRLAHAAKDRVPLVVLVSPDPERIGPRLLDVKAEILLVCAEEDERRSALGDWGERARGRVCVIPRSDRAFLRGLVELGRVVQEAVSPPGLIDLG